MLCKLLQAELFLCALPIKYHFNYIYLAMFITDQTILIKSFDLFFCLYIIMYNNLYFIKYMLCAIFCYFHVK